MKRPGANDHEEVWLLLPWLANGRLPEPLRWRSQRHLNICGACRDELALQERLCEALAAPESISYAPGPSLARLLQRIDQAAAAQGPDRYATDPYDTEPPLTAPRPTKLPVSLRSPPPRAHRQWGSARLAWATSPGLAWAATVLIGFGVAGNLAYRAAQPTYRVHSDAPAPARQALLHIAFARNLTIGEAAQLLHAAGAQVVEGPGSTGIFAISPEGASAAGTRMRLQQLAAQLRADPRVRWVEPLPASREPPPPYP